MAKPLYIEVLEDSKTLKQLLKKAQPWARPRLVMLLKMQKAGDAGITKEELMQQVGVCGQSINNWRKAYRAGGLPQLLSHKKTGFKPSVFLAEEKAKLGELVMRIIIFSFYVLCVSMVIFYSFFNKYEFNSFHLLILFFYVTILSVLL